MIYSRLFLPEEIKEIEVWLTGYKEIIHSSWSPSGKFFIIALFQDGCGGK